MKLSIPAILLSAIIVLPGIARATTVELPQAAPAQHTVGLVEQWRLGDDEEGVLLGSITTGLMGDDGQTYLVDRQLSQVLVIGPDGELITTLGRPGEGPGELKSPHGLVSLPDDAIGVIEGFPGRIIGIKPDGDPAGDITLGTDSEEGGFNLLRECIHFDGRFVASTGHMVFDTDSGKLNQHTTLGIYDDEGALLTAIATHSRTSEMMRQVYDEAAQFSEFLHWAASADGVVYTTPVRDEYVITAYDFQGKALHTFHRELSPRPRSKEEKEKLTSDMKMVVNGKRLEVENKALDVDQTIRSLAVAADGRLFVTNAYQHRSLLPVGTAARFDIISPTGEFLSELTVTMPDFDGTKDTLIFLDGTHYLALLNYDNNEDEDADEDEDAAEMEPLEVVLLHLP